MCEVKERLQRFANDHKLVFEDDGEVGVGRPCVGFMKGNSYIAYNPVTHPDYDYVWPLDRRLCPPSGVPDAYHKHDCMAVLVQGDRDKALGQLAEWIAHLERQGTVKVVSYGTGARGLQALVTGIVGHAVRLSQED